MAEEFDFDNINHDEELEEEEAGEDNNFAGAVDIGTEEDEDEYIDEEDDYIDLAEDENDINTEDMVAPPTDNAAKKMVETFGDIYSAVTELSSMANIVIGEQKTLNRTSKRSVNDIKLVLNEYEKAHKKIYETITNTQNYFEQNQNVAKDISELDAKLQESFIEINNEIKVSYLEYKNLIENSTKDITDSVKSIGNELDLKPLSHILDDKILKVIGESSLKSMKDTLDNFDKTYFLIADNLNKLNSVDGKKGLFEELSDEIGSLDEKLSSVKRWTNWVGIISSFFIALVLGICETYFYMNSNYQNNLSTALVINSIKKDELYADKIEKLREENRAYRQWKKKYSSNNLSGFGFYDDSNEPYFYYDKSLKGSIFNGKIYIKLGSKK